MTVGVIGRLITDGSNAYGIWEKVNSAIISYGSVTLGIIPNLLYPQQKKIDLEKIKHIIDMCDAYLFQGGSGDISPFDLEIMKYVYKKRKPVLGLCFGMQTMGVFLGGRVVKMDNDNHKGKEVRHEVLVDKQSKLYEIIQQETITVNSRHSYMLENIKPTSVSKDGVVEAIEDKFHPFFIGVQWHPEDLIEYDIVSQKIFKAFLSKG